MCVCVCVCEKQNWKSKQDLRKLLLIKYLFNYHLYIYLIIFKKKENNYNVDIYKKKNTGIIRHDDDGASFVLFFVRSVQVTKGSRALFFFLPANIVPAFIV